MTWPEGALQLVPPANNCECGCGGFPKKGGRFILGHNSRVASSLKGIPAWNKGKSWTEAQRVALMPKLIENHKSEDVKNKISSTLKGRFTGENHPNWNGGSSFSPYPLEWNDDLKKFIRNRDSHKCQNPFCEHRSKRLHVHHIDYNKQNCSQFNLITLCTRCHAKTISNRGHWKEFYYKIVWSKYL